MNPGTLYTDHVEILATEVCDAFTLKWRSDGILHSHTSSNLDFNIESLKKFNEVMGRMVGYKKVPLLITFDDFAIPPVETREFWALKESAPYACVDGYVAITIGHQLVGKLYLAFNKPGRPTKIFNTMPDAVEWLKRQRIKE